MDVDSPQVFVEELLYAQQHDMFWKYKNGQDMVPAFQNFLVQEERETQQVTML